MPTSVPTDEGRFFDGDAGLGGVGQCGPYSSDDYSEYVRYGLNFDLEDANRGVVRDILSMFQVQAVPAARQILVQPGAGFAQGKLGFTISNKTLDVPNNLLGAPRLDRLVLRRDSAVAVNRFSLEVLTGTTVAYPALTQNPAPGGIWEIPLWRWATPFPFVDLTGIVWDHTNDERCWANLANGYHAVLINGSGGDLEPGTVVHHTAIAGAFATSGVLSANSILGVTMEPIPNGLPGKLCLGGPALVRVTGVVGVGDPLVQSATAGIAQSAAVAGSGAFAIALQASAGGLAYILALVNTRANLALGRVVYTTSAASYTNNTVIWTDVDAVNISVTIPVYTGRARVFASFHGSADNSANSFGLFDLCEVASGVRAGDATYGLAGIRGNTDEHIAIEGQFTGLSRGNHTFRLQFRNYTAGGIVRVETWFSAAALRYPIVLIAEEC